jgi:hypothetical protein
MRRARHDAVSFQLTELLNERLLQDAGYGSLKLGKAQNLPIEQMKDDRQFPAPLMRRRAASAPEAAARREAEARPGRLANNPVIGPWSSVLLMAERRSQSSGPNEHRATCGA